MNSYQRWFRNKIKIRCQNLLCIQKTRKVTIWKKSKWISAWFWIFRLAICEKARVKKWGGMQDGKIIMLDRKIGFLVYNISIHIWCVLGLLVLVLSRAGLNNHNWNRRVKETETVPFESFYFLYFFMLYLLSSFCQII